MQAFGRHPVRGSDLRELLALILGDWRGEAKISHHRRLFATLLANSDQNILQKKAKRIQGRDQIVYGQFYEDKNGPFMTYCFSLPWRLDPDGKIPWNANSSSRLRCLTRAPPSQTTEGHFRCFVSTDQGLLRSHTENENGLISKVIINNSLKLLTSVSACNCPSLTQAALYLKLIRLLPSVCVH